MDISTSVLKAPSFSSIRRRKPMHTYQSPSAAERPSSVAKTLSALSHNLASTSASTSTSRNASAPTTNIIVRTSFVSRKKYPMAPPLPLYHPLGRLALSLPPLEPSSFGHTPPISIDDSDSGRRSSVRSRRPAAKLRDAAEEDEPPSRPAAISNVSAIAAVAAREIKEKTFSPRKKRAGGGAGAKRKRKDVDDGDATYPAKRTRNPRGVGNALAEEGSPTESVVPLPEITSTPDELQDDSKRIERRSTRSSGASKRRDSSASEATSGSASAGTRGASKVRANNAAENIDPPSDADMRIRDGKEEGEVSEEAP